jgi:hypothetical protein
MTPLSKMRLHQIGAAVTALTLRVYFIWRFPVFGTADSPLYSDLARNWLDHRVYGLFIAGTLTPVDIRAPGYPAFLALVYALAERTQWAVTLAQAFLDVLACFLIAGLARHLAPTHSRSRVFITALWLAALCPFTADYTAAVLAETLTIFFTVLALWILLRPGGIAGLPACGVLPVLARTAVLGGLAVGLGTLARPETPLLLAAAGLVICMRCRRPRDWSRILHAGALLGMGLLLALLPWAARNWHTLHKVQFLAPRYAELPGEFTPRGFNAWTGTWMWRFRDVYLVPWKLNDEALQVEDIPSAAFDSPEERGRVAAILEDYNETTTLTPPLDAQFAEIARERSARHPLRTYLKIPIARAAAMWFTPRIELLPFSGRLWRLGYAWEDDPIDFSVTLGLGLLNFILVGLAIAGAWMARRHPATAFLVAFILVRTAFMTHVETPEPRYVIECFPAILALAAQARSRPSSTEAVRLG